MIRIILLIIVIIAVASYFNFSIRSFIEGESFQGNFGYVWNWTKYAWTNYLEGPMGYLWNDVFIELLWNSFISNLQRVRSGQSIEMMDWGPEVPETGK
jgi:hypothetical protein